MRRIGFGRRAAVLELGQLLGFVKRLPEKPAALRPGGQVEQVVRLVLKQRLRPLSLQFLVGFIKKAEE